MKTKSNAEVLFDHNGRRIPYSGMRVFNQVSLNYYKIKQPVIDFEKILLNSQKHASVDSHISAKSFSDACIGLRDSLKGNKSLSNLFKGVHVPFICAKAPIREGDIGSELVENSLPSVASSFKAAYPDLHCKAVLQGNTKLSGALSVQSDSRYEQLINAHQDKTIVGWYFPQALQEYDVASQSEQMKTLPPYDGLVLSGSIEVSAAIVGSPGLLVNKEDYPPVLCLSSLKHDDDRMILCYKAYGLHLEFWGMSQMLTPGVTQVSEQWTGGLTLFTVID